MGEILDNRCIVCGCNKIFGTYPVCRACQQKEEEKLEKVHALYHAMQPGDTVAALAEKLETNATTIKWYLRTGIIGDKGSTYQEKIEYMKRNNLNISERTFGDYIWLEVGGKVDSMNAEDLKLHIESLLNTGWKHMIMDLSGVAFFCSTGIRVVLSTYKKLNSLGGSFYIENPSKNVSNVLGMVALNTLLLK